MSVLRYCFAIVTVLLLTVQSGMAQNPAPTESGESSPQAFVFFSVPDTALTVGQNPNGSLWVSNTNPALTGETLKVLAETAGGEIVEVWITVPAPNQ